jgi:hypothetical protein
MGFMKKASKQIDNAKNKMSDIKPVPPPAFHAQVVPEMPKMPHVPDVPKIPDVPKVLDIPKIPDMRPDNLLPTMPPMLHEIKQITEIPAHEIEKINKITDKKFHEVKSFDKVLPKVTSSNNSNNSKNNKIKNIDEPIYSNNLDPTSNTLMDISLPLLALGFMLYLRRRQ